MYELKDVNRIQIMVSGAIGDKMKTEADRYMEGVQIKLFRKDSRTGEEVLVQTAKTKVGGKYQFQ